MDTSEAAALAMLSPIAAASVPDRVWSEAAGYWGDRIDALLGTTRPAPTIKWPVPAPRPHPTGVLCRCGEHFFTTYGYEDHYSADHAANDLGRFMATVRRVTT
jgi:hypothetical protein